MLYVAPADCMSSRSIRERAEHTEGKADAGALELPIHLQSAILFPGHRIHVRDDTFRTRNGY